MHGACAHPFRVAVAPTQHSPYLVRFVTITVGLQRASTSHTSTRFEKRLPLRDVAPAARRGRGRGRTYAESS